MNEHRPDTPHVLTEDQKRKQRIRSIVIALSLVMLAVLFFLVTIVRLGGNVGNRAL